MPACRDCPHFSIDRCLLAGDLTGLTRQTRVKWESRACMHGIFMKHLPYISGTVLEIGYGIYKGVRRALRKKSDVKWLGVDPRWEGTLEGELKGSAAHIPLPDNSVDWVLAFETIEHWVEFGETVDEGLEEISRVLKPGGKCLVTAPMFQHGSTEFILGKEDEILQHFHSHFRQVESEKWREDYEPLSPLYEWMYFNRKAMLKELGEVPSMWKLEIVVMK